MLSLSKSCWWAGPPIGYSGTSARRSRRRSSVETIWQGKAKKSRCWWSVAYDCLSIAECRSHQATDLDLPIWVTSWWRSFWAVFLRGRCDTASFLDTRLHRVIRIGFSNGGGDSAAAPLLRRERCRGLEARNTGSESLYLLHHWKATRAHDILRNENSFLKI